MDRRPGICFFFLKTNTLKLGCGCPFAPLQIPPPGTINKKKHEMHVLFFEGTTTESTGWLTNRTAGRQHCTRVLARNRNFGWEAHVAHGRLQKRFEHSKLSSPLPSERLGSACSWRSFLHSCNKLRADSKSRARGRDRHNRGSESKTSPRAAESRPLSAQCMYSQTYGWILLTLISQPETKVPAYHYHYNTMRPYKHTNKHNVATWANTDQIWVAKT